MKEVHDIADVLGRYYTAYRSYERDQRACKRVPKSIFETMDYNQQETLATMSLQTEEYCNGLSNDDLIDLFRKTFGLKSSASAIEALNGIQFTGAALQPATWAEYNDRFLKVYNQIPIAIRPPGKEVAKRYIGACPSSFLKNDIMSLEPADHQTALKLVMERLNDVFPASFEAPASQAISSRNKTRIPKVRQPLTNVQRTVTVTVTIQTATVTGTTPIVTIVIVANKSNSSPASTVEPPLPQTPRSNALAAARRATPKRCVFRSTTLRASASPVKTMPSMHKRLPLTKPSCLKKNKKQLFTLSNCHRTHQTWR
jgi:hypothetical protein